MSGGGEAEARTLGDSDILQALLKREARRRSVSVATVLAELAEELDGTRAAKEAITREAVAGPAMMERPRT